MTTTLLPTPTVSPQADGVYRFSVSQYHELMRHGIVTEDDRLELIDGLLVSKMTMNPPHRMAVKLLRDVIHALLPYEWYEDSQAAITLSNSEPEPDVMIVRGQPRDYAERHPSAEDIGLVVEVSNTTLTQDRGIKLRIYAEAGIPVYWIVNLDAQQIEVYSLPSASSYAHLQVFPRDASVPVMLDGNEVGRIPVADILP